jgi:DsbC/DsbD-like thiol-disulfide interchange protein
MPLPMTTLRSYLLRTFFALALLLVSGRGVRAQSFMAAHAKVDLLAEQNTLEPGRTAWIGVLFDIEKGWHIYWVNPGDAGEAPKFQWQLPAGFRAGEVRWPVPARIGTGIVIDYGYEGKVLLSLPLDVPATYKPGTPAVLSAGVTYLICHDVCIPAKAQVRLAFPVAGTVVGDAAARHNLFNTTRGRWPQPLPAGWKVQAADGGKSFLLSVETGMSETQASFFPLDQGQVDNAGPQLVTASATGARITLKKSDQLLKPIATLRGVLVLGSGRAFVISAPVAAHR